MVMLNYFYRKTASIKKSLIELEILKKTFDFLPNLPHIEENLRRQSLLKSSLYSSRIEGNRLKLEDLHYQSSMRKNQSLEKKEVFNILKAMHWLYSPSSPQRLTLKTLLKFHALVLMDVSSDAGHWRREPAAIFNKNGEAIYLVPPASELPILIKQLIKMSNQKKEPGLIRAAMTHFAFEKIHPFLDGNGRVGRLVSTLILKNSGYGFRGWASLEKYLSTNRQTYYALLEENRKDITNFVDFFLKALRKQAEEALQKFKEFKVEQSPDFLLPRRREILEIIKDHRMVTFDFIQRRFVKVSVSTLHYDLKQLIKSGFILKLGITKGVFYSPKL